MRSVSVVVCTRDRPAALTACLRSLAESSADEVLVVDNGTEQPAVATSPVRVVVEPTLGLSHARNRGLAEATGEVVLFVDDDATARAGLVSAHREAYQAGVVAAGGPIRAVPTTQRPRWLDPSLEHLLSVVDRGGPARDLDVHHLPFGANLSVDKAAALAAGGFAATLGRRGGNLSSGEETDLLLRLLAAGGRIRWCPEAVVDHHLASARLRIGWFIRRAWAQGCSDSVLRKRSEATTRGAHLSLALRFVWTALRPGGTPWPPGGPPPLRRRAAVEVVRRVRLLGAAAALARR